MGTLWRSDQETPSNLIRAFSAHHVIRLTGLSNAQLRYWDQTGFFSPRYAAENRRSPFSRVYSFQDVVGLRTLGILRREHKIPLQQLRRVARELAQYNERPWSELVLYVLNREVHFREPDTEKIIGVLSKQYTFLRLRRIIHDVAAEAQKLKKRTDENIGRIERHRYVMHNAWVVSGTRIPAKAIWRFREAGYSPEAIMREYPLLTQRDIEAALQHENRLAKRA